MGRHILDRSRILEHINLLGFRGATAAELSQDFDAPSRINIYPILYALRRSKHIIDSGRKRGDRNLQTVWVANRELVPELKP